MKKFFLLSVICFFLCSCAIGKNISDRDLGTRSFSPDEKNLPEKEMAKALEYYNAIIKKDPKVLKNLGLDAMATCVEEIPSTKINFWVKNVTCGVDFMFSCADATKEDAGVYVQSEQTQDGVCLAEKAIPTKMPIVGTNLSVDYSEATLSQSRIIWASVVAFSMGKYPRYRYEKNHFTLNDKCNFTVRPSESDNPLPIIAEAADLLGDSDKYATAKEITFLDGNLFKIYLFTDNAIPLEPELKNYLEKSLKISSEKAISIFQILKKLKSLSGLTVEGQQEGGSI